MTERPSTVAEMIREHYNTLSPLYRLFWGEHIHHGLFRHGWETPRAAQLELLNHCSSILGVPRGCRVLDVGCGYGATAIYLGRRYGCRCTGLTISGVQGRHAVQRARSEGLENLLDFVVCDAETHEMGNGIYDLAWVMESSEHFSDRATFFLRAATALRERGRLLLSCWAARALTPQLRELANLCACPDFQTLDTYLCQITGSGLRIERTEELTALVAQTWDVVQRRTFFLMPSIPLWPRVLQEFAGAIKQLRRCFRERELQYWVVVGEKR